MTTYHSMMPRVMLAAALLSLSGCSKKPTLTELKPVDINVTVSMPQPAQHRSKEMDFGGMPMTAHAYSSQYDDVVYVFNYQLVPEQMRPQMREQPLEAALDVLQSHVLASTKSRLLNQTGAVLTGPNGSFLGRETSFALPDGKHKMIVRMYRTDDAVVQLATTLPMQPSYNQELYATRFLESARLR